MNAPAEFSNRASLNSQITDTLLDLFDDAALRAAVTQALENNLDVLLSAKQLELAGIDLNTTKADAWPQLSGNVNASRANQAGDSLSPALDVQWEVDIWGRQSDRRFAARADQQAQIARHDAMRASTAAQLMQAWFDAVTAHKQQTLEGQRLKVLQASAQNARENYRSGIGALEDLSAIERDVALSKAALALNTGQSHDAVRGVEILLGQYPDNDLAVPAYLPRLLPAPAAGVPLTVLTNRPDMRAAWQDVVAANKRISVSQKDLLPQISITGQFGSTSSDFGALSHGATIWSLASALTVPIFQAGRLKANIASSKNRADQAVLTYLQTALTAFAEVERGLEQEHILARRETQLAAAVTHARAAETTTETRYRAGLVDILSLLSARNAVFDIQSQLWALRNARLQNRVALGLALGTGV
ncbi:efflux transporter outer membrane subunit [Phaeobacter sp. 11ANDIMAR09]|uniref:efflux transporter outer membrane subunit n=1 Tax=Phaeobacter sp. 11ANDIMAR09 TaxID=1225647 RepID=UPI0006C891FC|nr:TolC family protein [Phaeobacter sp. 11ANDIMAR09]KPD10615.1 hypothetical protein AN476_19915 [Phaeobacter sp. 11ANDIMAR09]